MTADCQEPHKAVISRTEVSADKTQGKRDVRPLVDWHDDSYVKNLTQTWNVLMCLFYMYSC